MDTALLPQSAHQEDVGRRLRRLIDLLDMSYVEAAVLMGVSKQVVRNWMAGDSYPSPYAVYRLCRLKHVNYDFIFLGDWSLLPSYLAKKIEEELRLELEEVADRPDQATELSKAQVT